MKVVTLSGTVAAPAKTVYALFLNPEFYKAVTGKAATIVAEVGSSYKIGTCSGKVIHFVKNSSLVRTMKVSTWDKGVEAVSLFKFADKDEKSTIDVAISGVPEAEVNAVKESVNEIFKGIKDYLAKPSEPDSKAKKGKEKPVSTIVDSKDLKKRGRPKAGKVSTKKSASDVAKADSPVADPAAVDAPVAKKRGRKAKAE
jgi:hypothetical protein